LMRAPPEITCASVSVPVTSKSMRIPLQLIVPSHTLKTVDSYTLIDSGADISCIDYDFVKKHHLPTSKLEDPICSRNADGSLTKKRRYPILLYPFYQHRRNHPKSSLSCYVSQRQHHFRTPLATNYQPNHQLDCPNPLHRQIHQ